MPLPYITEIKTVNDFRGCLENNPGVFIIKFGADWCQPCKMIENDVLNYFAKMPNTIQCAMIDVDDSIELYGFLKKRKMVGGIPCILAYFKGNVEVIPDEFVSGTDKKQLEYFFNACLQEVA